MNARKLGELAREVRKSQGLTQVQLAELVNCGPRFVLELEQGKETLQWGKLLQVLQGLGIELTAKAPGDDGE